MSDPELLKELQRYVRFDADDERALAAFVASYRGQMPSIAEEFYARILEHPYAARVLSGGDEQLARLKRSLGQWLIDTLTGPWDAEYLERHSRIGRKHVEVGLEQHYMFVAMNLIRRQLCDAALGSDAATAERLRWAQAIHKILDLELAVMLHTYREDYSAEVRDRERHALVTQLLPTVAKELHNPLTIIDSSAYLLSQTVDEGGTDAEHIRRIRTQAERASRITEGMLELARERRPVKRRTALLGIVHGVTNDDGDTPVHVQCPTPPPSVLVDPQYAEQILRHLVRNATEAAPAGRVEVHVEVDDDEQVVVRVCDDGPGIPAEIAHRLFQPLATTKSHGAGLGLSLCLALAEAQGGTLRLAEGPLPGACLEWRVGPLIADPEAP